MAAIRVMAVVVVIVVIVVIIVTAVVDVMAVVVILDQVVAALKYDERGGKYYCGLGHLSAVSSWQITSSENHIVV